MAEAIGAVEEGADTASATTGAVDDGADSVADGFADTAAAVPEIEAAQPVDEAEIAVLHQSLAAGREGVVISERGPSSVRGEMSDASYRKRLAADLPKWLDAGWISTDSAAAILSSIAGPARRTAFSFSAILGTLGALLLGLAVLAYVGAQWEAVPRIVRFGLVALAMLVAYAAAFQFDRKNLRIFAEAGILAAGLVYAGAIALVGQTYHLSGDFAGAVMLFEAGIVGAALFTGSPTMTVLGLVGAGYWTWLATVENHVLPHWPSLVAIGVGVLVATVQRSHYGRIVAILALMYWLGLTVFAFGDAHDWSFVGAMALYSALALAVWSLGAALAGMARVPRLAALGEATLWPGLFAILLAVGVLQLADHPMRPTDDMIVPALIAAAVAVVAAGLAWLQRYLRLADVLAVLIVAAASVAFAWYLPDDDLARKVIGGVIVIFAALWAVALGQSGTHPIGKSLGLFVFGAEVIYLYVFTIGTMLDTALAFLIGGVLFIVLAYVLFRIDRILGRRATAAAIVADLKMDAPLPPSAALVPVPELPEQLRSVDYTDPAPPETPEPPPAPEPDSGEARP